MISKKDTSLKEKALFIMQNHKPIQGFLFKLLKEADISEDIGKAIKP